MISQSCCQKRIWIGLFCVLAIDSAIAATANCAIAQITPDNTLGTERSTTQLDPQFPIDIIGGGATRGTNLFHSFSEFNVAEGQGAYFFSPSADIQNILARVTGGNPSIILGTIGTFGNSIPNLFLINPSGIIFGPTASLDVSGSFVATTADAVLLGDRGIYSASNPAASNLLTVNPSALFFNGTSTAGIVNRATTSNSVIGSPSFGLEVPNGESLLLVGGDVRLDGGNLFASGGQVELGAVAAGTVGLNIDGDNLSLNYSDQAQRADIVLTNNSFVGVAGSGGGNIVVNARNIDILEKSVLAGGILSRFSSIDAQAGDINLNAIGKIAIEGRDNSSRSGIFNTVGQEAVGQGGNINIIGNSLSLDNANLATFSSGRGNAGQISIQAKDSVSFVDSLIFSSLAEGAIGKGGNVDIQTHSLSFERTNLGTFTASEGSAGNIDIKTDSLLLNRSLLSTDTFGQGNAGNVFIQASDFVSIANNSQITSKVASGAVGKGGDINISARSLSLADQSLLFTATTGQGEGGNVFIQASDFVSLINSGIYSSNFGDLANIFLNAGGKVVVGNAGRVEILTGSLLLDKSILFSGTFGFGNAGDVFINASGRVSLENNSGISSDVNAIDLSGNGGQNSEVISQAVGNGGDINIEAESLTIDNDSYLSTETRGQGNAGDVYIRTSGLVSLTGSSAIFSSASALSRVTDSNVLGQTKSGDIRIEANQLNIDNSSLGSFTARQGSAGAIFAIANNISIANNSRISSAVLPGGIGNAGNIEFKTRSLSVTGGSQIRASVEQETDNFPGGQGTGGNIFINANDAVEISGVSANGFSSAITTSTNRGASGLAGNIIVNTTNFRLSDGAVVSALTANSSNAGNITINANNFEATGGGQVLTSTSSGGSAGNITLNVTEKITLNGTDPNFTARFAQFGEDIVTNQGSASGLFANTAPSSTGDGGSIFIDPIEFNISDGAGVSVSSQGQGNAGNVDVQAGTIILDRGGFLSASTASGEGGNLNIRAQDLLLLRRNSNISGNAGGSGNGGNINLDAALIVAQPLEDSNIIADAIEGRGGNINITTEGIFGIQSRPEQTSFSDITASSELGIDGTVDQNTPDVDPAQGLVALPVDTVDASSQITAECTNGNNVAKNNLTVTGRGGLPLNPGDTLSSEEVLTNWATLAEVAVKSTQTESTNSSQKYSPNQQIVEAQGWVIDPQGKVILTAQAPNVTPNSNRFNTSACQKS